jgi:hypothetical protein
VFEGPRQPLRELQSRQPLCPAVWR